MTDTWRPLGVDTEEAIAEYDALHDGVPAWMRHAFWAWVQTSIGTRRSYPRYNQGSYTTLNLALVQEMCQRLKIQFPITVQANTDTSGKRQIASALEYLKAHPAPLQVADYLLAHGGKSVNGGDLDAILTRSKSAWTLGTRAGKPALVRRVPLGVQDAADSVMARAGQAGARLAKAWEELYGITPNPSEAYRLAILAVEDAAIPVVSPKNDRATLGTVLRDMGNQKNWNLPMTQEHPNAPTNDVLIGMMRMLWHGQHDRHGGQPSAPGNVSIEEATVAVSAAVTLVHWFDAGLPQRRP